MGTFAVVGGPAMARPGDARTWIIVSNKGLIYPERA